MNYIILLKNYIMKKEIKAIPKYANPINNKLLDIIIDKDNKLNDKRITTNPISNISQLNLELTSKKENYITLNDTIITLRDEENYINATQLSKACNINCQDWISMNNITSDMSVDIYNNIWIAPKLALQLSQFISNDVMLTISNFLVDQHSNKDKKIKILEDICLKKQHRIDIPGKNVVYILTTNDNEKNRIYIIGKAMNLKNRIGVYNKTAEHKITYYKECIDEEHMGIVESNF